MIGSMPKRNPPIENCASNNVASHRARRRSVSRSSEGSTESKSTAIVLILYSSSKTGEGFVKFPARENHLRRESISTGMNCTLAVCLAACGFAEEKSHPLAQHFPIALFFPRKVEIPCHATTATQIATRRRTRRCWIQRGITEAVPELRLFPSASPRGKSTHSHRH